MSEAAVDDFSFDEDIDDQSDEMSLLDELGLELAEQRSSAIDGRLMLGIEEEWTEDEEYYEGIDDLNRGQSSTWTSKPAGQGAVQDEEASAPTGSNIFANITRPYCDAFAARWIDMLIPSNNDQGWEIRPTPIPELVGAENGNLTCSLQRDIRAAHEAAGDPPDQIEEAVTQTAADLLTELREQMARERETAKLAETQIRDWHVEAGHHRQKRKVIEACTKIGTGVLKGPVKHRSRRIAYKGGKLIKQDEIIPASWEVSVWNCYPDPDCGDDIQNGSFHFERGEINGRRLRRLKRTKGYLKDQIDLVLKEGPLSADKVFQTKDEQKPGFCGLMPKGDSLFEIWYYYGECTREQMLAAGYDEKDLPKEGAYDVAIEMINNHVIKIVKRKDREEDFPYDYLRLQRREGMPYGMGISRQLRPAQRIVNGAFRNMMDNAGLAGGPMWIMVQGLIHPMDNNLELQPRKGWWASEDALDNLDHLDKAIRYIEMPMMQRELEAIIMLGLKLAEDTTGLPMIMQGQQGQATSTVGGMQLLNSNASTVLRRVARVADEDMTEPHMDRYYRYLLEYGPDEAKGDFNIEARGASVLVERDIQAQSVFEILRLSENPMYGLDPKKSADQALKQLKHEPHLFQFDDEEWQKVVENLAKPKEDSSVQVAQLRGEVAMALEEMRGQRKERSEITQMQFQQQQKQVDREEKERDRQLQLILKEIDDAAADRKMDASFMELLETIKGNISTKVMELETQVALSDPPEMEPPSEPAGRAENGEAFHA